MLRLISPALAVLMLASACAGDDATAGYLDEVAASFRQMESDTFAALPRDSQPTRERLEAVIEARAAAVARLEALEPPSSLRNEHEALVITLGILVSESQRFMERTVDLGPAEFTDALAASVDLDVLAEAVGRACRALQARATDAGHAPDLRC